VWIIVTFKKQDMSKVFNIFTDKGEFSWRKIMTAGCLVVFMTAELGYLISHNFKDELPTAYWAIDASVFAFYFAKKVFENVGIVNNTPTPPTP
jgi:hypothetical protein